MIVLRVRHNEVQWAGTKAFSTSLVEAAAAQSHDCISGRSEEFVNQDGVNLLTAPNDGHVETSTMPLKISLKPGEKFVVNGAVLTNGQTRLRLGIENKVSVLREKDIMQPEEATTPARRIYLPVMLMHIDADAYEDYYTEFALRTTEFMSALQNRQILATCIEMSRDVMTGNYYKALILCRRLIEFEEECLSYGSETLERRSTGF